MTANLEGLEVLVVIALYHQLAPDLVPTSIFYICSILQVSLTLGMKASVVPSPLQQTSCRYTVFEVYKVMDYVRFVY